MTLSNNADREDGEIGPFDDYNPAFEYPGDNDQVSHYPPSFPHRLSSPSPTTAACVTKSRTTTFRLVSLKSSVLSRSKRVVILDGHPEVSIGRDVATSARVRLKELTVSKYHASIYWDGARREWAIVDMGSMHGTFVRSARYSAVGSSEVSSSSFVGTRLSEPRKASMPKILHHLDQITVGGTTFLVHEHLDGKPCTECTVNGQGEISLFATSSKGKDNTPMRSQVESQNSLKRKLELDDSERDPKRTMAKLKNSLLQRHSTGSEPSVLQLSPNSEYKDRSALRRHLHPESPILHSPVPPLPSLQQESQDIPLASSAELGWMPPTSLSSSSSCPLSSSNIGHKLLLMQGWSPGTALGEAPDIALTEPLQISMNAPRAGLGSTSARSSFVSANGDWKEEAKRRRWDSVKE